MNDYDPWVTNARAYIGRVGDTVVCGVVTDRGLIHAGPMAAGQDEADAALDVILLLRNHPDLNSLGVDFGTNATKLQDLIRADHRVAGSHVTALPDNAFFPGEPLMVTAREAAEATAPADEPEPRKPVRAATDGARDKGRSRGGYGWVTETGEFGYGAIEVSCALEAELYAIERLLAGTDADVPLHVEVDSRAAIALAQEVLRDQDPSTSTRKTEKVLRAIRRHAGRSVTFTWVKGHNGAHLNEAADNLAKLGRVGKDLYQSDARIGELARQYAEEASLATAS